MCLLPFALLFTVECGIYLQTHFLSNPPLLKDCPFCVHISFVMMCLLPFALLFTVECGIYLQTHFLSNPPLLKDEEEIGLSNYGL
jgi:intracellular septation protein A